jgi:hypothetical protein
MTRPGFLAVCRMIWLVPHLLLLSRQQVVSLFSQSSEGDKLYNSEKAWSSINHSNLSGNQPTLYNRNAKRPVDSLDPKAFLEVTSLIKIICKRMTQNSLLELVGIIFLLYR